MYAVVPRCTVYAMVLLSDLPRKEIVEIVVVRVRCVSGKLDEFCSCEVEWGGGGGGECV